MVGEWSIGQLPAVAFVAAACVYIVSGLACVSFPPSVTNEVADIRVPRGARCYPVVRRADYTIVQLAVGSPPRLMNVLFQVGSLVDDEENGLHLFGERMVESKSLLCEYSKNHTCYDIVLTGLHDPSNYLSRVVHRFRYDLPSNVPSWYDAKSVGAEGEMFLVRGNRYFLTSTHLCIATTATTATATATATKVALYAASTSTYENTGYDFTHARLIVNSSSLSDMPKEIFYKSAVYRTAVAGRCASWFDEIYLFPREAIVEGAYLALSDPYIYEVEPYQVSLRRAIVELGYWCASESLDTSFATESAVALYEFDSRRDFANTRVWNAPSQSEVDWSHTWRDFPSLPFRRLASTNMILTCHERSNVSQSDADVTIGVELNPSLESLPGLADAGNASWWAVVKLAILFLAAAVMWVRQTRETSCPLWLFSNCVHMVTDATLATVSKRTCHDDDPQQVQKERKRVVALVEDAALGFAAIAARVTISAMRLRGLAHDHQTRACVANLIGGALSLSSWSTRFLVVSPNIVDVILNPSMQSDPLARLGGSMAVVDASCAVLVAFAEPPTLGALSTFDDTARVLTGLLCSVVTLHRCLIGVTCNAFCYESHHRTVVWDDTFIFLTVACGIAWLAQTSILAVSLSDLTITPIATSSTRTVAGPDNAVATCLFLASVCLATPTILKTSMKRHSYL